MTPTVRNHQRGVSESLAQLCNCVPPSPWQVKPTVISAWHVTSCTTAVVSVMSVSQSYNIKHYIIISECLRRVMPREERAMFDKLRRPVCECRGAVYGFARSGRDFIMSFAGWLIMSRWLTVPETPALHVLWCDQTYNKGQRMRRDRGASWTKRACEGGRCFAQVDPSC